LMLKAIATAAVAAACLFGSAFAQPAPDAGRWRSLEPENTLYIDTLYGRIVVEMFPEIAPGHVARIKELAREKFYDGLTFHRVIENFMAQTGDPLGTGEGASLKPELQAEFDFRRGPDLPFTQASAQGGTQQGFYKTLPITSQPDEQMAIARDGRVRAWGLHCPGIASMARAGVVGDVDQINTANSQFFLMRAAYPSLDKKYSIWGRVVWGQDAVGKLAVGSPPPKPDRMLQVRVAADVPSDERAPIYVLRTDSDEFRDLIERTRKERGADFSICDVEVPVRVSGDSGASAEKDKKWWRIIPLIN
jgi:peptidylprolyl isomerase